MKGLRKVAAVTALVLAFTGVVGATSASPAEAATTIYSMKFDGRAYFSGAGWAPARWYWVDYNWSEERFQGKRDCYCNGPQMLVACPTR